MGKELMTGAGKARIVFEKEDFPLKAFDGEHDSLHARVLMVKQETELAIVSVELTSLPPQAIARFKECVRKVTGIAAERIFISVTHTFSAPHIPPKVQNEQEQRLSDILYERISDALRTAAKQAMENVQPVTIGFGTSLCGINVNRNVQTADGYWLGRNGDGASDKNVRALTFSHGGTVTAVLYSYDVQASVMDQSETADGKRLLSADLVGAASMELERQFGGEMVAVFLPGCAGDQAPILKARRTAADGTETDLHEGGFVLAEQLGIYLAECVTRAIASATGRTDAESDGAENDGKQSIRAKDADGKDGGQNTEFILQTVTAKLPKQTMQYATKELKPHKEYQFQPAAGTVGISLTGISFGSVKLLLSQPELNSVFGERIRFIFGKDTIIGTLVDGAVKYLPDADDFAKITYTAMNTEIGQGADEAFLAAVRELRNAMDGT